MVNPLEILQDGEGQSLEDKRATVYILGKNEKIEQIEKNVPLSKDQYEVNGQKYDLKNDKIEGVEKTDLRFYFRAGQPEPLQWERFNGEFSNQEMYMVKHDRSAIEGIMNALGIGGARSLNRQQWLIIIGIAVVMAVGFFVLRPKIMNIVGM